MSIDNPDSSNTAGSYTFGSRTATHALPPPRAYTLVRIAGYWVRIESAPAPPADDESESTP